MSDKISKLILCMIPTNLCNFRCEYCVLSQTREWERDDIAFAYPVEHIVKALSSKRLGGICYINLTAQGETLLYKDIVCLTRGLLQEGHYVEIVTNCSISKRIDELLALPKEWLGRLFFKVSYHYQYLKVKNLTNRFWDNVQKIKASPCSFTIELVPNDELVSKIDNVCNECMKYVGAVCHATVGRNEKKVGKELLTEMSYKEYVQTWDKLHSKMFDLKMDLFGVKRKEFCYAGRWSLLVDISSGETAQCYGRMNTQNIFKNLNKPIQFVPVGYSCTLPFCVNGHAHIAWGLIPELHDTCYYEVRNRVCVDGSNWVKNECADLFHQRLADNNQEYTRVEKIIHTIKNPFFLFIHLFHDLHGVKRKIKKYDKIIRGKF